MGLLVTKNLLNLLYAGFVNNSNLELRDFVDLKSKFDKYCDKWKERNAFYPEEFQDMSLDEQFLLYTCQEEYLIGVVTLLNKYRGFLNNHKFEYVGNGVNTLMREYGMFDNE